MKLQLYPAAHNTLDQW